MLVLAMLTELMWIQLIKGIFAWKSRFTRSLAATIELASEAEVADVLAKVREAAELGELDTLIEQQAQFGRRVTQKNKWTEERV